MSLLPDNYIPGGEIRDFPLEIIEKMLENQKIQSGIINPKVFEYSKTAGASKEGFTWERSVEGDSFWSAVIKYEKFNTFFERYPSAPKEYAPLMW